MYLSMCYSKVIFNCKGKVQSMEQQKYKKCTPVSTIVASMPNAEESVRTVTTTITAKTLQNFSRTKVGLRRA